MADPSHILGVSRVPESPVLHLNLVPFLGFPNCIHQDVYRTLIWHICVTIEHWYSQDDAKAVLACGLEFLQDRVFAVKFGLSIEIGRTSGGI